MRRALGTKVFEEGSVRVNAAWGNRSDFLLLKKNVVGTSYSTVLMEGSSLCCELHSSETAQF